MPMKIILLEKIAKLGDLGDTVVVKPGYARNYLLPQKKAVRATPEAEAEVLKRREKLLLEEKSRLDVAKARADAAPKSLTFKRSVIDSEGRLFGSVTSGDVVAAAAEAGIEFLRSEVSLSDGTIKTVGEYSAEVKFHPEVAIELAIEVVAENPEIMESSESPEQQPDDAGDQDDGAEDQEPRE